MNTNFDKLVARDEAMNEGGKANIKMALIPPGDLQPGSYTIAQLKAHTDKQTKAYEALVAGPTMQSFDLAVSGTPETDGEEVEYDENPSVAVIPEG
jgi:hypothetical protein